MRKKLLPYVLAFICIMGINECSFAETPNEPVLVNGMVPVVHNGSSWVVTDTDDTNWYDYAQGKWANIMLRDGLVVAGTADALTASINDMKGKAVTTEGSMYVWIPRYSYKISGTSVTLKWSNNISDDTTTDYISHPAFHYTSYIGGNASTDTNYNPNLEDYHKLEGIWIAKYESRNNSNSVKTSSSGTKWVGASIGSMFGYGKEIVDSNLATYGLTAFSGGNSILESHMLKNSEWSAAAYLETAITPDSTYGIQEMETGNEYVAMYQKLVGGTVNYKVRTNGLALLNGEASDIDVINLSEPTDNTEDNYERYSYYKGGAITETSSISSGTITSFDDTKSTIPQVGEPFLVRTSKLGFEKADGAASGLIGFRASIIAKTHSYKITTTVSENGNISPRSPSVNSGEDKTFIIVADEDCRITDVKVDGLSVGIVETYTFSNVTEDHTIEAIFENYAPREFVVNLSDAIKMTTTRLAGENVTVTAKGTGGKAFSSWTKTGITVPDESIAIFAMPKNSVDIRANFVNVYEIGVTSGENGSISPTTQPAGSGTTHTFTITPDEGYSIRGVWIDGQPSGIITTYTFNNVTENHSISAEFEEIP